MVLFLLYSQPGHGGSIPGGSGRCPSKSLEEVMSHQKDTEIEKGDPQECTLIVSLCIKSTFMDVVTTGGRSRRSNPSTSGGTCTQVVSVPGKCYSKTCSGDGIKIICCQTGSNGVITVRHGCPTNYNCCLAEVDLADAEATILANTPLCRKI